MKIWAVYLYWVVEHRTITLAQTKLDSPQRHRDTEAQRGINNIIIRSPFVFSLCLCVSVVNIR
jgi:hypothetical protein